MIFDVLCKEIEDYAETLRGSPLLLRARRGEVTPDMVARYLASIHYLLTQTPVHLTLAREQATMGGAAQLARYFEGKLGEEGEHHEWAEDDQAALESRFGTSAAEGPAAAMRALVAHNRAIIETNPTLYLAYILFAEYFTVVIGPEWVSLLSERCGIPAEALTAVSRHAELDKHHVSEGRAALDVFAADPAIHGELRRTLRDTMSLFSSFCDELCAAA